MRVSDMSPPTSVVLYGAGSALIADYEESCRRLGIRIVAAVQNRDGEVWASPSIRRCRVPEIDGDLLRVACLCPLFTPANRRMAWSEASGLGFTAAAALIDAHAVLASSAVIGVGGFVNAGAVVGASTEMGQHVVVNRLAGIGHHGRIGDFVSIGPGATVAGQVRIDDGAMIGAGAVVLPEVHIGRQAVVSAGAVVTRDVAAGAVVRGNPARDVPPEAS